MTGRASKKSQATKLVEFALESQIELWHTRTGDPYATIGVGSHREHHSLGGQPMNQWLAKLNYEQTGQTLAHQAIQDALTTLRGMALYEGLEHAVAVRVAGASGPAVYLDLGDARWRSVEVTASGWRIRDDAPVRFRRSRATRPLPDPERGGSISDLAGVVNVAGDDDLKLLAGWLLGALRPAGPYPILALAGEQGTGKSTVARVLRRLIDPVSAELRAEPRDVRDLMIAAQTGWIIALDNLSHLSNWLSDGLCRISTGGALATRQLYSDGEEYLIEAVRPLMVNGIGDVVQRGDLLDRALVMTLPVVPDQRRLTESVFWQEFDALAPRILGALLDGVSSALRRESTVTLATLPRMADWAVWVTAGETAWHWTDRSILSAYDSGRTAAIESAIEGDPVAVAVCQLPRPWTDTATKLLAAIEPPSGRRPRGWPESPRALSTGLRRLAPALRRVGIEVELGKREALRRVISIRDSTAESSSRPSSASAPLDPMPIA